MRITLDPWSADYGPALDLDEEEPCPSLDLSLEVPAHDWAPLASATGEAGSELAVVDGVRRIESYLRLEDDTRSRPALLGSLGVGGLRLEAGRAHSLRASLRPEPVIQRLVLVTGEHLPPGVEAPLPMPGQTLWRAVAEGRQLTLELQSGLRLLEAETVRSLHAEGLSRIVADGPLHDALRFAGPEVVGCIKSHRRRLLPDELTPVLAGLAPGERTPIFRLASQHGYERLTWYLRLAAPAAGETGLAGLVRLEVGGRAGLERAQEAAAETGLWLPRLKNHRYRDPRSPQNLVPIGALERELRRRMGDPTLIGRRVREWIKEAAA